MPQARFALHYSGICGGASLIGMLDYLYTITKKVPIYSNFKVIMMSLQRYWSLYTEKVIQSFEF